MIEELKKGFSIIIPTWNNLKYLKKCIEYINKFSCLNHEIILHINEGKDGTKQWAKQKNISFSYSESNLGVCCAVNRAFELCTKSTIMYFNDDMLALPDWDKEIINFEEEFRLGKNTWLSSIMIEPTGNNICCIAPQNFGKSIETFQEENLLQKLDSLKNIKGNVSGSTWPPTLLHRDVFEKIGGFSEEYSPGFGSDPDLAKKCWDIGIRDFVGIGRSLVYHFGSKSTGRIKMNNGNTIFKKKYKQSIDDFVYGTLKRGEMWIPVNRKIVPKNRIANIVNQQIKPSFPIRTWLDIGSGNGLVAANLKWNYNTELKIAIDPFQADNTYHDNTWIWAKNLVEALEIANGCVDLITCFDVIEHFTKEEGSLFLKQILKTASGVLIFTPKGFLKQDYETHPDLPNEGMIHKSGWDESDFKKFDMKVDVLSEFHKRPQGHCKPWDALMAWSEKKTVKQKILMLTTEYPPAKGFGLARYASELAKAMVEINHEVHVVTCNYDEEISSFKRDGVSVHNMTELIPLKHYEWVGDTILNNATLLDRALQINEECGPFDAIISHDWLASQTAKSLKNILGIPWLLIMHDTEPGKRQGRLSEHQKYIAEMEAWSLSHADKIITTCQFMLDEINRLYKVPKKAINIIPCGVNPERFKSDTNISDFRNLFVRDSESLIFYAGRLSPMKGVEDLFEAFFKIIKEGVNARLVYAGAGVLRDVLEKQAGDAGLQQRILFVGTLSDKTLGAFYQAADCVVVPSRYEPFGMVAIEAAVCGAEVVASEVGGLKEVIHNNINISGVLPGKPEELSKVILKTLKSAKKGNKYSRSQQTNTWNNSGNSLLEIIEKL
jgi:glycosyltransferase involved in cell wall biosynthesis